MCVSCSVVGHVALVGGLWLAGWRLPVGRHGPARAERLLTVDLIPRDALLDSPDGGRRAARLADRLLPSLSLPRPVRGSGTAVTHGVARPPAAIGALQPPVMVAAPVPSAPSAATGAQLSDYQRRLYEIVARNCRYPAEARRLHVAGVTHLAFKLDRDGTVTESWIETSSGSEMLDEAALEALDRSQPLPPIPDALPAQMDFIVEIDSSVAQHAANPAGRS